MKRFYAALQVYFIIACTDLLSECIIIKEVRHADQTAFVGRTFTIPCYSSTTHPVNWWHRPSPGLLAIEICVNGELVNGHRKRFILDRNSYNLTILSPTQNDNGTYTCVENSGLDTQHVTQLNVIDVQSSFQHPNQSAFTGQSVVLLCNSRSLNPVNWLYRKSLSEIQKEICVNGELMDENQERLTLDRNSYKLTILEVKLDDAGIYTCVENAGFGASHVTFLTVNETLDPKPTEKRTDWITSYYPSTSEYSSTAANNPKDVQIVLGTVLSVALTLIGVIVLAGFLVCRRIRRKVSKTLAEGDELMSSNPRHQVVQAKKTSAVVKKWKVFGKAWDSASTWTSRTISVGKQRDVVSCIDQVVEHLQQRRTEVDAIVGMNTNDNPEEMLGALLAVKLNKPFIGVESTSDEAAGDNVIRHTFQYHNQQAVIEIEREACRPDLKVIVVDSASKTLSRTAAVIALVHQTGAKVVEILVLGRDKATRPPVWSLFPDNGFQGRINDDVALRDCADYQHSVNCEHISGVDEP
jgi:adenine/guanine phosphoribosyltransferase-like PRPP-binding protein